jgi:hypothetical protein
LACYSFCCSYILIYSVLTSLSSLRISFCSCLLEDPGLLFLLLFLHIYLFCSHLLELTENLFLLLEDLGLFLLLLGQFFKQFLSLPLLYKI